MATLLMHFSRTQKESNWRQGFLHRREKVRFSILLGPKKVRFFPPFWASFWIAFGCLSEHFSPLLSVENRAGTLRGSEQAPEPKRSPLELPFGAFGGSERVPYRKRAMPIYLAKPSVFRRVRDLKGARFRSDRALGRSAGRAVLRTRIWPPARPLQRLRRHPGSALGPPVAHLFATTKSAAEMAPKKRGRQHRRGPRGKGLGRGKLLLLNLQHFVISRSSCFTHHGLLRLTTGCEFTG